MCLYLCSLSLVSETFSIYSDGTRLKRIVFLVSDIYSSVSLIVFTIVNNSTMNISGPKHFPVVPVPKPRSPATIFMIRKTKPGEEEEFSYLFSKQTQEQWNRAKYGTCRCDKFHSWLLCWSERIIQSFFSCWSVFHLGLKLINSNQVN